MIQKFMPLVAIRSVVIVFAIVARPPEGDKVGTTWGTFHAYLKHLRNLPLPNLYWCCNHIDEHQSLKYSGPWWCWDGSMCTVATCAH
jgi:hypothetical protein